MNVLADWLEEHGHQDAACARDVLAFTPVMDPGGVLAKGQRIAESHHEDTFHFVWLRGEGADGTVAGFKVEVGSHGTVAFIVFPNKPPSGTFSRGERLDAVTAAHLRRVRWLIIVRALGYTVERLLALCVAGMDK